MVESLRPSEPATGYRLFESVLQPAIGDAATFHDPHSRELFLKVLVQLATDSVEEGVCPILQIEVHGDDRELRLSNGDNLPWVDLMPVLRRINIESRNNLLVVVAACEGINLGRVFTVDPLNEAPARIVIGPEDLVSPCDIEAGMKNFYTQLLSDGDGNAAVQRLMQDLPSTKALVAERIFANAMSDYFKRRCTPSELERRYRERLISTGQSDSPSLRKMYWQTTNQVEARFEEYKNRFFMINQYPENRNRFSGVVLE